MFKTKEGSKMGKDHHHNKLKYKTHTKQAVKKPPVKKPPKLPSNHEQYDKTDGSFTNSELFDKDFKRIAELPTSQGSYFQTENDYFGMVEKEPCLKEDIFNLDLKLFNFAMKTIPFYERVGLDSTLLRKSDKEEMDEKAQKNSIAYKKCQVEKLTIRTSDVTSNTDVHKSTVQKSKQIVQELEDVSTSNIKVPHKQTVDIEGLTINSEEKEIAELEDWLDDVLN